jgi:hypothetical protein
MAHIISQVLCDPRGLEAGQPDPVQGEATKRPGALERWFILVHKRGMVTGLKWMDSI